ncbi:transcriptional regulator [Clostridium putrefaciens]|uniref:Transcriptional regulator n=1 Tax=Clostridium putrefaciens TaxID=99675 RepID=A0A381J6T7_9CLOT|nr:PLP-dependent aminotransferase family protein [Clostridium putrefaciens]SUY46940.1 transcriptional regulator [Clostridium putrefaciens]
MSIITKYEFIINYINHEIEIGNFNDKLPSIRALAIKFSCSNSTVIRAYSELEKQNLIYALPKSGYFVVDNKLKYYNINESTIIDFSSGEPDMKILPYEDFQKSFEKAIEEYKYNIFGYSLSSGFTPLKESVLSLFKQSHLDCSLDKIFITSGGQQALSILSTLNFGEDRESILVEQPTYNIFLKWLNINKFNVIGIERDFNGIDLNKLEHIFKNKKIKFFYTMPRMQNPLGTSLSEDDKKQIVYLANKYGVYIVEDDYLSDLNDASSHPLYKYDKNQKVIYIKSFSKTLIPGIRLAACIIPQKIINEFSNYKVSLDLVSTVPMQGALSSFIDSGHYNNYTYKLKNFYGSRMRTLKHELDGFLDFNLEHCVPNNGMFSLIKLPNTNIDEFINIMSTKDISIRDGSNFYLKEFTHIPSLRISLCNVNEDNIIKGMDHMFKELKNSQYNPPLNSCQKLEL